MPRFTATLITYNEERDLPQALASVEGLADEIVVVDSLSTDRTVEIARKAGARVVEREFRDFAEQRTFASSLAGNDWVLVIDADEVLSPELRASIAAWKESEPKCAGYRMARRTNYLGRWIRHCGWYPQYSPRLHRRDRTRFAGTIHERIDVDGPLGLLAGDLLHYTVRSFAEHYAKQEAFTTLVAEAMYARGRRRWRAGMWFGAPFTFLQRLLIQRGILDGYQGCLIAWTSARYVWTKYRKLGILARGGKLETQAWPQAGAV